MRRALSLVPLALAALVAFWLAPVAQADTFKVTLTSVAENTNVADWHVTSDEVTPACPVEWSVRKYRLHGGKQEGVDVVELRSGRLTLLVVPTRGMGIWSATLDDVRLGWDSPVGEIVHPSFVNLAARGGLGWLDGFGEWLCRCGLENNGHPGQDIIVDNTGATTTVDLTLHGKIAYLPAQEVRFSIDRQPPYRMRLVGVVHERMMFGPKLRLTSELSTEPGSESFTIRDAVTNLADASSEFQLLYHCNFGPPLLEDQARFVAPVKQVHPMNEHAQSGLEQFDRLAGPSPGYVEQVYCATLYGDEQRRTQYLLHNAASDRGVAMAFSLDALPYLTLWKNTAGLADGYVVGVEPGTNYPYSRGVERAAARVPKLAPGETYRAELEVRFLLDAPAVQHTIRAVEALQANRPTRLDPRPLVAADSLPGEASESEP